MSPTASGEWDSGIFNRGQSFSFTFDEAGTFAYLCTVHPFMIATVTVAEQGSPADTPTPMPTATPAPAAPIPVPPTPAPIAPTATSAPVAQTIVSPIVDFTLENLNISVGDTVRWQNADGAPHTATVDDSPVASGEWESGILNTNQSFEFTFDKPGKFAYFCTVHPFMTATVTVQAQ